MDEQQRRLAEELLFSGKKVASFVKSLYFGKFESSLVFPFPKLTDKEQKSFSEMLTLLQQFIDEEIDPDAIDRHAEIPSSVIKGLGRLGVLGMTVPKEYGGLGMSQQAYCQVVEKIAARCASTALLVNAHHSIGLRALLLFGTEKQKQHWLPKLSSGEWIAAFSLTEPNAGSDASAVETRAVYDPDRKVYRINGKKQWTTNGSIASVLTVMAKTEVETPQGKQEKVTAFLVTPKMRGFKVVEPGLEKVGMRGTRTTNLEFTDMEVPEENVLGPVGAGLRVCLTVLDYGRTTFGAMCTGIAKVLVRSATDHAINRHQFKRPLASFALVKKKLTNMAMLTQAMEATTTLTAGLIDRGMEEIMLESAILKVFVSDALWQILYDTMQIYGGRSFFTSAPFERMMRDARLNMIGEGSNEVMRAFIGAVGMRDVGLELKGLIDALKNPWKSPSSIWKHLTALLKRWPLPRVAVRSKDLQSQAKLLAKGVNLFGISIIRVLKCYREEVVEKQLDLDRIAESAIALYTATAVLSKLDGDNASLLDSDIGKFYCQQAMKHLNRQLDHLFCPYDEEVEALADRLTNRAKQ